jgi:hypothetical protein
VSNACPPNSTSTGTSPGDGNGRRPGAALINARDSLPRRRVGDTRRRSRNSPLDVDADDGIEHVLVILGGMHPFALDPGIVEKAVDGVECGFDVGLNLGPIW